MYKCDECNSKNTYVKKYEYKFLLNNEEYSVTSNRRFCAECNNFVYDELLDDELLKKVFRKKEEILGLEPEKIINLRKSYNLSQAEFSKIIGCAKKTLISYEKGTSIPNDIYLITLKMLLDNPEVINFMIDSNKERFTNQEINKINEKISSNNLKQLINNDEVELTDFNGYTELNNDKIYNLILLLSDNGILKTKLLKELFYCDFVYYKENCCSITGLEYAKITYGPVPDSFEKILKHLENNNYIKYEINYKGEYEIHKIISSQEANKKVFNDSELELISRIKEYFKNYTVKEIVDKSHKEKAFSNTEYSKLISYDYAFDIELN